jgi:outer membrane protein assembly factor BamB
MYQIALASGTVSKTSRFTGRAAAAIVMLLIFGWRPEMGTAEDWPCWRGPRGDGTSLETGIPTQWNGETGLNIAWKVAIPGEGHSSPVVWRDHIFLTSCMKDTQDRILLCLDRIDGSTVWQRTVMKSVLETRHQLNSFASGTPATDGEILCVSFLEVDGHEVPAPNVGSVRPVTPGKMLAAAFDMEGKELWRVHPGEFTSAHGFCSSPVIYQNLVIVNGDHDGDSYIVGLDRLTGKTVWKTPREHKTRSYCTPIIRDVAGRTQLVFSGSKRVVSLDPKTGTTHWVVEGPTEQFVSSMVFDGDNFFLTAGFPTHHVLAIRPNGSGDVSKSHIAWHSTEAKCYVPSPVLVDQYLFVADDRGTVNCFDRVSGKRHWQDRLGSHYSASLATAGGLVYFTADDGVTAVVRPDTKLDVISKNPLGEYSFASPAVSQGQIFIRGEKHLFAIGPQKHGRTDAVSDQGSR